MRWIVIGGGITGLSAAWRLKNAPASSQASSVMVLDSQESPVIQSFRHEGFLLEAGPDCFLAAKPQALDLARSVGLESELIETRPEFRRSFIWRRGTLHAVPEGFYLMAPTRTRPFLQSGLISWPGKWRVLLEPWIRARKGGGDESLASFVRRRLGSEMLDWMAQPMIAGIYGADPEQLSLRATFPQFLEMEEKYGSILLGLRKDADRAKAQASGPRYSLFYSLRGGMQQLTDRLTERLGSGVVRQRAAVASLHHDEGGWRIRLRNGESFSADGVILALPASAAAALLTSVDRDLAADIGEIRYGSALTVNLGYRTADRTHLPEGAGFVVPQKAGKSLLGATIVQNKFMGRVPKGQSLVRAFVGGAGAARWIDAEDRAIVTDVRKELREITGLRDDPILATVHRYPRGLPQYQPGHLQRILKIEERALRWKGLRLAGNWLRGVGLPDCIASGAHAAEDLLNGF